MSEPYAEFLDDEVKLLIDVVVRINGKDVRHEGDWLKDLSVALAALAPKETR